MASKTYTVTVTVNKRNYTPDDVWVEMVGALEDMNSELADKVNIEIMDAK